MNLTLLGLSYKTTPLELRERFSVHAEHLPLLLTRLREIAAEAMILSTCNRFELLVRLDKQRTSIDLIEFIRSHCGMQREQFEPLLYTYNDADAVRHLFRVAASLDSMVVGEAQILGQMKEAFAIAQEQETIGAALRTIMERAFRIAKKVRTETGIGSNSISIASVAAELACKVFGEIQGKTAMVVGAGKMGLLALQHLRGRGIDRILVTNRTFAKAEQLAEQVQGKAVPFEDWRNSLAEADIVIGSTGSPHFILGKQDVLQAIARRKNKPMFFMDIALPRDFDPEIHEIPNAFLYDLDDLKTVSQKNRIEREREAERAEEIVLRETEIAWNRLQSLDVNPTIREIHARVERVGREELQLAAGRVESMSDEQRQGIERLIHRLADKILQNPFAELRGLAGEPDCLDKILFIQRLFGIQEEESTEIALH